MKTPIMQKLDGYLGPPLCWARSLFFKRSKLFPDKIKKVLIIKMFGIGSLILMTPMIRSIRRSYPSAKIYFMSFNGHRNVCQAYKMCDEFVMIRRDSLWNFCADTIKSMRLVKREGIDIIIDAEFFSRYTALFTSLCRRSFLTGFFNPNMYRGKFLDRRCYFNQYYHMKRNFMELANSFCPPCADYTITYPDVPSKASESVAKIVRDNGLDGRPIAILNPNSSDITPAIDRSWPIEYFAAVGRHLSKKGYGIAVIGSPEQKQRSDELSAMCGEPAVSLAGAIGLEELIALIGVSFCLITNDSGPAHIAVSLNVPTMVFFGTDTPVLYGAHEDIHKRFFRNLPCSPCLSVFNYKKGRCEFKSECIRGILPEEVMEAFDAKEELFRLEYGKKKHKVKR
jgi:ADP-heptose:LPS heptosyltransferase